MKVPVYLWLIILLVICASCEKPYNKNIGGYKILSGGCGSLSFVDSIGTDFSTALDSLIILRESFIDDNFFIEEVEMEVDFYDSNREFKGIKFLRPGNQTLIFSMSDVLDSNGNYYCINWCPD